MMSKAEAYRRQLYADHAKKQKRQQQRRESAGTSTAWTAKIIAVLLALALGGGIYVWHQEQQKAEQAELAESERIAELEHLVRLRDTQVGIVKSARALSTKSYYEEKARLQELEQKIEVLKAK